MTRTLDGRVDWNACNPGKAAVQWPSNVHPRWFLDASLFGWLDVAYVIDQ